MCAGKSPHALSESIPSPREGIIPQVQGRDWCRGEFLLSQRCPLAADRKLCSVLLWRLQRGSGLSPPALCRVLNGKLCTFL